MHARIENGKVIKYSRIPNTVGSILNASKLSEDKLAELGFFPIEIPSYNSDTEVIYNIHFVNDKFTYDVKEREFPFSLEEAKLTKLEQLRAHTHSQLSITDWYITRKTELGVEIPQSVLDTRQAIRDSHNQKDEEIFALETIVEVLNYSI